MKDRTFCRLRSTLADIRANLQKDFGVDVSYFWSWQRKEFAMEEIHENREDLDGLLLRGSTTAS